MIKEIAQSYTDEFHRLQWELFPEEKTMPGRVIQITASRFAEGVTTTTLALATSMARTRNSEDVLVVEANLRDPAFHQVLGLGSNGSLARVLEGQEDVWGNIERVEAYGISVLPAGRSPEASGGEDLESYLQNLGDTLSKLRGKYRYILVDSPPLVPYRDSNIIARVTDGVIFVVEANVTRAQVLDFALRKMQTVEAKILGLVLNKREFRIPNWLYRYL